MDHAALAERFNTVGDALAGSGHRVVIRQARALLQGGDVQGAIRFLEGAGRKLPGARLAGLVDDLRLWLDGGGEAARLTEQPMWQAAVRREGAVGQVMKALNEADGLAPMVDALAEQTRALAAMEPLDIPADGIPLASIFGAARRAEAVVEVSPALTARSLTPASVEEEAMVDFGQVVDVPSPAAPATPAKQEDKPNNMGLVLLLIGLIAAAAAAYLLL